MSSSTSSSSPSMLQFRQFLSNITKIPASEIEKRNENFDRVEAELNCIITIDGITKYKERMEILVAEQLNSMEKETIAHVRLQVY